MSSPDSPARGVQYALAAYVTWGFFPLYFKGLAEVPPPEVLCHRIVGSALFLLVVVFARGEGGALGRAFSDLRTVLTLTCSTVLLALNWLVFIYAVGSANVLQSSLGYFVNPLVSAFLGWLFLKERLRPVQNLSLALAACGVVVLTVSIGRFPWIALVLGLSFGSYGLLRKTARVESLLGLTVETCLLAPLALAYLLAGSAAAQRHFLVGVWRHDLLLGLAGVVTAVPLLLFVGATRRLRLATVGFLQYVTPSLHLLLAVWLFGEPFTPAHVGSFGLIWAALAIYSLETLRGAGVRRRA